MRKAMRAKDVYRALYRNYPDVVGVKEVSAMLNVSTKKVYQLVKANEIERIPCGRTIRITKIAVINYVLQSAQEPKKSSNSSVKSAKI